MDRFPIVTDRTSLRRLATTDLAAFQLYRHDQKVGRYKDWLPQSDADAAVFLKEKAEAKFFRPGIWFQIGIAARDTDTLIGDIVLCLSRGESEVEIGFTLRRESHGLGLGREAIVALIDFLFDEMGIRKIVAVTDPRNIAAIKLLE